MPMVPSFVLASKFAKTFFDGIGSCFRRLDTTHDMKPILLSLLAIGGFALTGYGETTVSRALPSPPPSP